MRFAVSKLSAQLQLSKVNDKPSIKVLTFRSKYSFKLENFATGVDLSISSPNFLQNYIQSECVSLNIVISKFDIFVFDVPFLFRFDLSHKFFLSNSSLIFRLASSILVFQGVSFLVSIFHVPLPVLLFFHYLLH